MKGQLPADNTEQPVGRATSEEGRHQHPPVAGRIGRRSRDRLARVHMQAAREQQRAEHAVEHHIGELDALDQGPRGDGQLQHPRPRRATSAPEDQPTAVMPMTSEGRKR